MNFLTKSIFAIPFFLNLATVQSFAFQVQACDAYSMDDGSRTLWKHDITDNNTHAFLQNNHVTVSKVDLQGPEACSQGLAVVMPDKNALPGRIKKCFLVQCFKNINFASWRADWRENPMKNGGVVSFKVEEFTDDGDNAESYTLALDIDLATETLSATRK